jgi:DNA-binding transcriptional MerR regulator
MEDRQYTIQEICDQTGLPRRTIHFYTQQGIIPPPQGAGVGSYYTEMHLLKLRLVPLFRQDGLRLDQIRKKLETTPIYELQLQYQQLQTRRVQVPPPARAQTYVHYTLPGGMILMVPESFNTTYRSMITQWIEAGRQILSVIN